jgi:hypothetical protein
MLMTVFHLVDERHTNIFCAIFINDHDFLEHPVSVPILAERRVRQTEDWSFPASTAVWRVSLR